MSRLAALGIGGVLVLYGLLMLAIMKMASKEPWWEPKLKSTDGHRWAFMKKFVIERVPGVPYLTRWRIIQTPWFGVYLHKIDAPDPDPHPHDHPYNFVSIILRGWYREWVATGSRTWRQFSMHKMHAPDPHFIKRVEKGTLTLLLVGPRQREWGFHTPDGWVDWKRYLGVEG